MKKLLSSILLFLLFATQAFASQDFNLWKNDITHRYSPTSLTYSNGVATVVISGVTTNSLFRASEWDAYFSLRSTLLGVSEYDSIAILPKATTAELAALSGIIDGQGALNISLGTEVRCLDSIWMSESNAIGITASITQTQAGGTVLSKSMNFIETVVNENDAVTLSTVSNGIEQTIINDASNILQIFPALGDDLGNGTNVSTHLDEHEEISFWGKNTSTWHIRHTSESFHASMYEQDNSTEFIIHAVDETHCYHSAGLTAGDLGSWTFNAGSAGASVTITSVGENGGGTILVSTNVVHGITVGDIVCQTALADSQYIGVFTVLTVPSTTTYTVTANWTATSIGFVDRPAYLAVKDIATGFYNLEWASTMQIAGSGVTLSFDLHDGMTTIPGSKAGYKFASTATIKQPNGLGEKIFSSGGRVFFTITNETDATNITPKHLKVRLEHI